MKWLKSKNIWGLLVLTFLVGGFLLGASPKGSEAKEVSITYNGLPFDETTYAETLAQLLDTWQVDLNRHSVSPPPETKLVPGMAIVIYDKDRVQTSKKVASNLAQAQEEATKPRLVPVGPSYRGLATWYRYRGDLTAASRDFPKGTKLKVTALRSGKSVIVEVNDFGPQPWTGVALDLNRFAFAQLAPLGAGKIEVSYQKMVYAK